MIYVLLLSLLILLLYAYALTGKNILSPWIISILMFVFSTTIYIVYSNYFDRAISEKTVLVIISALAAWGAGEVLIRYIYTRRDYGVSAGAPDDQAHPDPIVIPAWFVTMITICIFIMAIYAYYLLYKVSLLGGNAEGILKAAKYARAYMLSTGEELSSSIIFSQLKVLFECAAYFFGYVFFYNLIWYGKKDYAYLGPVIGYCLMIISTTGRVDYIKLASVLCIIAFVFIKTKNGWKVGENGKILRIALLSIAAAIIVFRLVGYLTDASVKYAFGENIARYTAGGILGLDIYMDNPIRSTLIWGQSCFRSIYMSLRGLGANIPQYNQFQPFYSFGAGVTSNGYTGLLEPLKDFGVWGMLITRFLLGLFYGCVIESARRKKKEQLTPVRLIVAGLLFYPVVMCSIGDVYASVLSVSFLYKLFYLYLLQHFLLPKAKSWG